jgi:type I restriction enzyme S subunit
VSLAEIIETDAPMRRFKPYPAYRASGIEWLGDVPAHWGSHRLKTILGSIESGRREDSVIATIDDAVFSVGGEHVGTSGEFLLTNERYISGPAYDRMKTGKVAVGDVLLVKDGATIGKTAHVASLPFPRMAVNEHVFILRTRHDGSSRFLFYLMASDFVQSQIDISERGAAQPGLPSSFSADVACPFPPLDEQCAITAFLDRETARIDALVAKKEELIELLQEQRAALITRAVTKGLDPNAPMKDSGIEWLGEVPKHWVATRLVRLTDQAVPIVYGILLPGPRLDEGVPYIGAGDVKKGLALDHLPRTTEEIASQYPRSRVRAGEIVYAIRGSFGAVEIVAPALEGVNLSRDAARIAPKREVQCRWLCWALRSDTSQKQFDFNEMGTAVTGVNIRDLKRVTLPCPPPTEQQTIADYLDRQTGEIDGLVATVGDGIARLQELRLALISAAVTGKIDARGELA